MYETPPNLKNRQPLVPALGMGFKKTTLDMRLHERLLYHLRANVHKFTFEEGDNYLQTESDRGYPSLICMDGDFNRRLMDDLQEAHEEWSGRSLRPAACYGIRVYQPGSFLYNHRDISKTHIVSSTICIDHRLTGRWPLYIEDLDGQPHEVSIEPGEMVFFEGARLVHGRPYPLEGEYYANIFVHYTPVGWENGPPPGETARSASE
jgi:prolyl 4-hydroxylase